jgi:uncharacterized protein (DUF362 family)
MLWLDDPFVAVHRGEPFYSAEPPFHPPQPYPEYPFERGAAGCPNPAYHAVRQALRLLRWDEGHFGTPRWNPLGTLVRPGDTVVLKPNFIRESHLLRPGEFQQVITHGSILRAVLDYVYLALGGKGRVIVADGPQTDSDFDAICRVSGLPQVAAFYAGRGFAIEVLDLRRDRWFQRGDVIYRRARLPGDPAGYAEIDLGEHSEFSGACSSRRFYGADYDLDKTASFHRDNRHRYILCRTVLDADVLINLPKLKTHKKTGVTLSLKNLVGANGYRNCLPHHAVGTPEEGGDEFPASHWRQKLESGATVTFKSLLAARGGRAGAWARGLKRCGRLLFGDTNQVVRSGNWYGNDTAWRMVLDLNRALLHFDAGGRSRTGPRRYFALVDGLIAGQGDGPMAPDAAPAGLVIAGCNPAAVDTVCAVLMGFDYRKLPVVRGAWRESDCGLAGFGPEAVRCVSNLPDWNASLAGLEAAPHLRFRPHFGWTGQVERP